MIEKFNTFLEENNKIIIFRHQIGDGDALGSQWAMYYYLKEKYPNKEIYAVGDYTLGYENIFESPDELDDKDFEGALAIVLDTANTDRISDQRYKLCKKIVKIDHHIDVDSYGDLEFVFTRVTSTAEILTNLLRVLEKDEPLSKKVAKNLYMGIISDTQLFSIPGVNQDTFITVAYLCESDIQVGQISRELNEIDLSDYMFRIDILNNIVFDGSGLAYLKIRNKDLIKHNISHSQAKRNAGLMRNIKGINIWILFIEQEDNPEIFNASLRSNEILINDVAQKFGGGGHKFASGVKNLDEKAVRELIKNLKNKL